MRSILRREAYRGELSYGKTKKRNKLGDRQKQRQTTWETIERPDLRIVSEKLAHEVDAKLKGRRELPLASYLQRSETPVDDAIPRAGRIGTKCGVPNGIRTRVFALKGARHAPDEWR